MVWEVDRSLKGKGERRREERKFNGRKEGRRERRNVVMVGVGEGREVKNKIK